MRKIYLLFIYLLAFSQISNAQSPSKFNYQALIQNNEGSLVPNTEVSLFIEIIATSTDGDVVYSEVHTINTDDNSMIHLHIGNGVLMSGSFLEIDWEKQDHFLKTSLDITGGNNFELVSNTQLVAVPYAMYADQANTVSNLSKELPSEGNTQDEGIKLTRGAGSLKMVNGTLYDGEFLARIEGQSTHSEAPGLIIVGTPSNDEVGTRGLILRAGRDQALLNSNVLNVQNYITDLMVVKNDGKVGIATNSPEYTLDVNGVINGSDLKIQGESIIDLIEASAESSIKVTENGFVGIGTSTPTNLLDVALNPSGNLQGLGIQLSRGIGYLKMANGTLYDGEFLARIEGKSTHAEAPGLIIVGTPSNDEVGTRGLILRAGRDQALLNSNVLNVQNYTTDLMVVKNNGNVGIGTNLPEYTLDVNGVINASDLKIQGESIIDLMEASVENSIKATENGYVGIGTSTPTNLLDVALNPSGNLQGLGIQLSRGVGYLKMANGTLYDGEFLARIEGKSTHSEAPGLIIVGTPSNDEVGTRGIILRAGRDQALLNSNVLNVQNHTTDLMVVKNDGNVGIGTNSPEYTLDVNGVINGSDLKIQGESIIDLIEASVESSIKVTENGYVGIGTSTPTNLLDVALNPAGNLQGLGIQLSRGVGYLKMANGTLYDGEFLARIEGKSTHAEAPGLIIVGTPSNDEVGTRGIILRAGRDQALVNSNVLNIQNHTTDLMVVKNDGNVGIGTSTPTAKLQVTDGDVYIENATKGVIMTSPNGGCWRMTVDNTGNPVFTAVTCPE